MASIFNKTNNLYENPKRNTFDHSFQNNLTLNFGELIPCFCKECIPGDSFKIDPTMSISMIPMPFPVQTRIRAYVHFFYVTNRSIYKDWMDFVGNTKNNLEIPYLSYSKEKFRTSSIYDYMGLPTTSVGQKFLTRKYTYSQPLLTYERDSQNTAKTYISPEYNTSDLLTIFTPSDEYFKTLRTRNGYDDNKVYSIMDYLSGGKTIYDTVYNENPRLSLESKIESARQVPLNVNSYVYGTEQSSNITSSVYVYIPEFVSLENKLNYEGQPFFPLIESRESLPTSDSLFLVRYEQNGTTNIAYIPVETIEHGDTTYIGISSEYVINGMSLEEAIRDYNLNIIDMLLYIPDLVFSSGQNIATHISLPSIDAITGIGINHTFSRTLTIEELNESPKPLDISDGSVVNDVYQQLKINALPFRAYEAIYNSFYRDERNNPLIINGDPVYNQYLPFDPLGGEDDFDYTIRKRNWEADFLTTAVQSPQQGVAPLVGITAQGEISFKDSDSGELYTAKLNANDGDTIDSFTVTSANMPSGNLHQLVDFASAGISISDLRGVNALQRWLEINMRRGLRYKDQIMSHFGVDVRYDELLMPEFIGGFTQDVYVNRVNQTVETNDNPLGWQAGQGGAFGSSKHSINHYCQEHGYIIGILSIAPVANYTQLLPKHFLKHQLLDYFFPEFGHLGMQPITYSEVCPIEARNNDVELSDVFGYQRAWYDYLASTDEVHGLFRTTLRNFVINRKFAGVPELSPEFLTINHNELDDVFAVTSSDDSHKFLGQIYFDCKIKRPIPEYGIPKLEV